MQRVWQTPCRYVSLMVCFGSIPARGSSFRHGHASEEHSKIGVSAQASCTRIIAPGGHHTSSKDRTKSEYKAIFMSMQIQVDTDLSGNQAAVRHREKNRVTCCIHGTQHHRLVVQCRVEVYQSPVLQKAMQPDDSTHIHSKVPPAFGRRQVPSWALSVQIDHQVPRFDVRLRRLRDTVILEPLLHGAPLDRMNRLKLEPRSIRRHNHYLALRLSWRQQIWCLPFSSSRKGL